MNKGNILVVDDTAASLKMLAGLLKDAGYKVRPVPSGILALQAAAAEPPDLILLDITMPEMDGYEVCQRLKESPALKPVPVLFISALTETTDKVKAFQVGGLDFVTKPFQFDEVRARVETHLALRRLQLELERKYDELRKLEQMRDNLTHMIVHDLRTPLTAIAGYLQLMQLKKDPLSEEQRRYVDGARTGTTTLIEMISSLLDVNRLESGDMPLDKEICDLSVVAAQAMKTLEGLTIGRNVTLEHPEEPVHSLCDSGVVLRVIANLVGNALKFTPKSGSIKLVVLTQGETVRVEVRDTGYGIADEYLDRVFDKFAQVDARGEHKKYSSGLGLTFCKLATEAHGGRIGVSSEVGKGSTFWFELNRANAAQSLKGFQDVSVLVIDDDPAAQDLLVRFLAELGLKNVETAGNGKEGLQALDRGPRDIIFCDLDMPEMDGIEFLRHLGVRQVRSGIVLVSGLESRLVHSVAGLTRSHDLNLLGIVQKPMDPKQLEQLLREYDDAKKPNASPMLRPITERELSEGLGDGSLCVYFQPQVQIETGKVHGVEALARWKHAERGILGPGAFVPLAENSGQMDVLTERVIRLALEESRQWRAAGLDLHVSVNISVSDLARLGLPDYIAACAKSSGIEPSRVIIELTEGQVMKNLKPSLEILGRVRLKGIGLSIDDFGTGYSSLEQLKRAPFTELKIDRSFVFGAANDPAARAILESSVVLGRKLGMTIVAEGVETRQDWDLAASAGCDLVQGYFVARPMPAAEIVNWVKEWERPRSIAATPLAR
jgi:EAL domain-containing protein (putative c-di-GMP-specific phosphodiesterase class I)/signal transduction histidine kinase